MILTTVTLPHGGVDEALALLPSAAGVGQILAADDRNLVIGRASNLRRWAAGHLGRARPAKVVPGKLPPRPPTDLTPIAVAIAYVRTTSPFAQRLAFERLMARHVPLAQRRDLKRPAYLRLDPHDGFPRLVVQPRADGDDVFGPFRDTRAAARARDALYKHFRIRECDFGFKGAPVVSAAVAADIARALAGDAEVAEIPSWVGRAGGRSLVVEPVKEGVELYPVVGGGVAEEALVEAASEGLESAIAGLDWNPPLEARDDTPWLNAWRHGKHAAVEIRIDDTETPVAIAARIHRALRRDASAVGGVVG